MSFVADIYAKLFALKSHTHTGLLSSTPTIESVPITVMTSANRLENDSTYTGKIYLGTLYTGEDRETPADTGSYVSYVKYSDGLMKVFGLISVLKNCVNGISAWPTSNGHVSGTLTPQTNPIGVNYNYPVPFITKPAVTIAPGRPWGTTVTPQELFVLQSETYGFNVTPRSHDGIEFYFEATGFWK